MNFYRYEIITNSNYVTYNNDKFSHFIKELKLITLNLHKETPKGYWIGYGSLEKGKLHSLSVWVSKEVKNSNHAFPSKKEALFYAIENERKKIHKLKKVLNSFEENINLLTKESKNIT